MILHLGLICNMKAKALETLVSVKRFFLGEVQRDGTPCFVAICLSGFTCLTGLSLSSPVMFHSLSFHGPVQASDAPPQTCGWPPASSSMKPTVCLGVFS